MTIIRNQPTIRQRRKATRIQDDLRKLIKERRKEALLTAKDARKPLPKHIGIGRDPAPAAGGSGSGSSSGSFITTDGIFTLVFS